MKAKKATIIQIMQFIICTVLSIIVMTIGYMDSEWLLVGLALLIFICNLILAIGFIRNLRNN